MRLQSEDLYQLLRRVHEGLVCWHTCSDVHPCGFAWVAADMTEPSRELCGEALHARLLDIGTHRAGASAVFLTPAGVERLRELRDRHNASLGGGV